MINKSWHLAHVMPKNATLEQRVEWHIAHLAACGCRKDLPPAIAAEIAKRGLKIKEAPVPAQKAPAKTTTAKPQRFEAVIENAGGGGMYVCIPFDVEKVYGTKGRVPVKATFDGEPYRGSIMNMGNGPMIGVLKAIREKIGKGEGDTVRVVIERDTAERTVEVPEDLQKLLNKHKAAKAVFEKLSYSHQREYVTHIEGAKQEATRLRRLEKTIELLDAGKKER